MGSLFPAPSLAVEFCGESCLERQEVTSHPFPWDEQRQGGGGRREEEVFAPIWGEDELRGSDVFYEK